MGSVHVINNLPFTKGATTNVPRQISTFLNHMQGALTLTGPIGIPLTAVSCLHGGYNCISAKDTSIDFTALTSVLKPIQEYLEKTSKLSKFVTFVKAPWIDAELTKFRNLLLEEASVCQLRVVVSSAGVLSGTSQDVKKILQYAEACLDRLDKIEALVNGGATYSPAVEDKVVRTVRGCLVELEISQNNEFNQLEYGIRAKASNVVGKSLIDRVKSWVLTEDLCSWDEKDVLGTGTTATVYKGKFYDADVAIKVFKGGETVKWHDLIDTTIAKEVDAWKKVSSKCDYIVQLLGFSIFKHKYIVMELCENGTAAHYLRWLKGQSRDKWVPQLIRTLHEVAHIIQAMHKENILHRDIKGANILIRADESAAVGDFGLGRDMSATLSHHNASSNSGSLRWMAPERIPLNNQAITDLSMDLSSDIWSYGMLVYELLFDELPLKRVGDVGVFAELGRWEVASTSFGT
ncbi:hypothetical protein HDU76_007330 [Blyttiomyces sp. JEL0837]|nr:hypothetical protein HDU76_007330 [Blyttiomyces sp. JEL0837]